HAIYPLSLHDALPISNRQGYTRTQRRPPAAHRYLRCLQYCREYVFGTAARVSLLHIAYAKLGTGPSGVVRSKVCRRYASSGGVRDRKSTRLNSSHVSI